MATAAVAARLCLTRTGAHTNTQPTRVEDSRPTPRSHISVHTEVPVEPASAARFAACRMSGTDCIPCATTRHSVRVAHGNAGRNKRIGKNCSGPWLVIRTTCRGTHGLLSHVVAEVANSGGQRCCRRP
ncbi:hypothetical protein DI09_345p10 [Mitosporidium daphniae]|uniref:Uncharacterized protein n=1 Tax=Mitosporidium daphniae TaxID=1485682 RepID=A0A098VUV9_9MICR|nr:uncharacterized protein DI09_345p10 [Mitosporidium daphniae]KGG51481.1 hypothetical protein DI09_345p10 [Mitosporidium daphniae]|eukprot:XP_013237917.1 uncharacterized protein DI09_345p10 [Mitosporidium daphniae]